jgi:hypothetical protein
LLIGIKAINQEGGRFSKVLETAFWEINSHKAAKATVEDKISFTSNYSLE